MHKHFMLAALEQAWLGRGLCAPNPSVGAVLVHDQNIISRAFHRGVGHFHAEQQLFEQLPLTDGGLTLYVTLEPCNHWGRTPPCVDIIIAKKISRVVFAYYDPNPVVAQNDTPAILRSHGIDVVYFHLPEIDQFYQSYHYWVTTKKPWVTAKIAQSLDGKIAGVGGKPIHLSNQQCQYVTHEKRLYSDVILTSAQTIQRDNPRFDVRLDKAIELERQKKVLAILDRENCLTGKERVFQHMKRAHLFHAADKQLNQQIDHCDYHGVSVEHGLLDLAVIIHQLGHLGYHDVWVEAGGRLFSSLHQLKLVNTSYFYIVPSILGENAIPAYHYEGFFQGQYQISWQEQADNMMMLVHWD